MPHETRHGRDTRSRRTASAMRCSQKAQTHLRRGVQSCRCRSCSNRTRRRATPDASRSASASAGTSTATSSAAARFDFTKKFLPDGLSTVDRLGVPVERRAAVLLAGAGPHVREHVRDDRALHRRRRCSRCRDALARRPGRRRGPGAFHRRGTEAPGAVPPARGDDRRSRCRRATASCPQPNEVASAVLAKSTWSVLALTCCIELFTQAHYRDEHRAGPAPVAAVQGRLPVPLEGRVAARDPRRAGVDARGRKLCRPRNATQRWTT